MTGHARHLLTALTAAAILSIALTTASANRLSITNGRLWKATWTSMRFTTSSNNRILCPLTLEGSFHSSTIVKTAELIGYITRGTVAEAACTGGTTTIRQETLPWHIRYRGYSGQLPAITLLTLGLIGASFRVQPTGGVACNTTTTATKPVVGSVNLNPTTHTAESLVPDPSVRIPIEGGLCPFGGEGSFEETSQSLGEVPNGNRISITLI